VNVSFNMIILGNFCSIELSLSLPFFACRLELERIEKNIQQIEKEAEAMGSSTLGKITIPVL
jgi:hypothetical protein